MELRDHDYVSNVRDAFFFFTSSFGQSENARTLGKGRAGGRTARKDGSRVRRARMSGRRRATRRAATADADATAERRDATNDDAEAKTPERPARPTDDVRATTRRQTDGRLARFVFPRVFRCLFVRDDDDGWRIFNVARDVDAANGFADRGRGGELVNIFFSSFL